jgi:predicted ATPase
MLHKLSVENLKSFGPGQEADLSRITLVYGPNSAGKSTLIQFLLLLKQTLASNDLDKPELLARVCGVETVSAASSCYAATR